MLNFSATSEMAPRERAAADEAFADEQKFWLAILEAQAAALTDDDDPTIRGSLEGQILRLRRLLHLASPEATERRRRQDRVRARRYRQRRRAAN